jgi:hypothetical protein
MANEARLLTDLGPGRVDQLERLLRGWSERVEGVR